MKKIILIALILVIFLNANAFALGVKLLDIRNKIFEESKSVKNLLKDSKDVILISSLWDACIMANSQLDAYFFMIGIFDTIKKENATKNAIDYLMTWLDQLKKTNELNLRSLDNMSEPVDAGTKSHIKILKGYFSDLNKELDKEIATLSLYKKTLK